MGRYVLNQLGGVGTQIIIPYRCEDMSVRHLRPMGDLGQIVPMKFDPYDYDSIKASMEHCNVVVNLTGKHFETMHWTYKNVHCDLPEAMAMAAAELRIETFVHISAMGADEDSSSTLLQSKALGEKAVLAALPTATILRPGPITGTEDRYMNYMVQQLSLMPGPLMGAFPLMDGGVAKQQPVCVGDVADAVLECITSVETQGKTYELGGPTVYTIDELADITFAAIRKHRTEQMKVSVPKEAVKFVAETVGLRLPLINTTPGIVGDWAERLSLDCVKDPAALGFEELNIVPSSIEDNLRYMELHAPNGARGGFLQLKY